MPRCVDLHAHAEASEEAVEGEPQRGGAVRFVRLEEELGMASSAEAKACVDAALVCGEAETEPRLPAVALDHHLELRGSYASQLRWANERRYEGLNEMGVAR